VSLRVRLVGDGWFPDRPGGVNRYLRELLAALVDAGVSAEAVVLGPAGDAPENVVVPSIDSAPLRHRVLATARAALRDTDILDAHFALYALGPLLHAAHPS
jgi:hypothetical protein